jgi:FAD synthetase
MFFFNTKIKQAKKLVMAFGTFDYLHAGHENFLKQAKSLGDYLLVILARDNTVQSVKGKAPLYDEKKRLKLLKQTGWADQVILGNHDNKHKVILDYKPSVIALGYDQFVFTQTLQKTLIEHSLDTEIVRLDAYFPQVYKSSLLKPKTQVNQNEKIAQTEAQYL